MLIESAVGCCVCGCLVGGNNRVGSFSFNLVLLLFVFSGSDDDNNGKTKAKYN